MGLYLLVGVIIGFLVTYLVPRQGPHGPPPPDWRTGPDSYIRQNTNAYQYISPLLDSEFPNQQLSQDSFPFEKDIVAAVQTIIRKYPDDRISFYYNDLGNPSWVGIGEREQYIPASLLKLPMAIAYYKLAESDPSILAQKITATGPDQNDQRNIKSTDGIKIGQSYTVEQLISAMLDDSDNNALQALYSYKGGSLKDVFSDMRQHLPLNDAGIANENYVSPLGYSRFLLVLYNATYLYRADSEKLLNLLTQSLYKDGLVAGVPSSVTVAHKFGERGLSENGHVNSYQFHDCGIVYQPGHPYELCIMNQGTDLKELQSITKEISAAVYGVVKKQK